MSELRLGSRLGTVRASSASADVWFAWCGANTGDAARLSATLLSHDERTRLGEYRSKAAGERYLVTRSLVRVVLSDHLGIPPATIEVSRTDTGKPILSHDLHFNVSHSGDLIVVAVSHERPVGVDVERRRDVPSVAALEERWLNASERRDFSTLRKLGLDESDAFLRIWSLKEARLKALGVGISGAGSASLDRVEALPLDELLASLAPHGDDVQYVGAIAFA